MGLTWIGAPIGITCTAFLKCMSHPDMPLGISRGFWEVSHSGKTLMGPEGDNKEMVISMMYDKCPNNSPPDWGC